MTWTYSGSPANSARDAVRFLTGDTSTSDQLVQDEEISWALSEESNNNYRAAALVCESIAANMAREADERVGDLSLTLSQRAQAYEKKAKALRKRALMTGVSPVAGGLSISRKNTVESDSDRVEPHFRVGVHDRFDTTSSTSR